VSGAGPVSRVAVPVGPEWRFRLAEWLVKVAAPRMAGETARTGGCLSEMCMCRGQADSPSACRAAPAPAALRRDWSSCRGSSRRGWSSRCVSLPDRPKLGADPVPGCARTQSSDGRGPGPSQDQTDSRQSEMGAERWRWGRSVGQDHPGVPLGRGALAKGALAKTDLPKTLAKRGALAKGVERWSRVKRQEGKWARGGCPRVIEVASA
jgi:hypothetical protein